MAWALEADAPSEEGGSVEMNRRYYCISYSRAGAAGCACGLPPSRERRACRDVLGGREAGWLSVRQRERLRLREAEAGREAGSGAGAVVAVWHALTGHTPEAGASAVLALSRLRSPHRSRGEGTLHLDAKTFQEPPSEPHTPA